MKTSTTLPPRPAAEQLSVPSAEMMAHLDGATYIRCRASTAANVRKYDVRSARRSRRWPDGSSLVEVVSTCNSGTNSPVASNRWLEENMLPTIQLGDIKDVKG